MWNKAAEVAAADKTTTGNGARKISASTATPTPANLWSAIIRESLVNACTATKALSKAIGISELIFSIRGCESQLFGTLWPRYLSMKARTLVPITASQNGSTVISTRVLAIRKRPLVAQLK